MDMRDDCPAVHVHIFSDAGGPWAQGPAGEGGSGVEE